MFTIIFVVFKMTEIANFLYFLLITAEGLLQFGQYISVHIADIEFLQKMVGLIVFGLEIFVG